MNYYMALLWIIFAHFLADWCLQPPLLTENKGKYWFVMLAHCFSWTGIICIALQYTGLLVFWKIPFLLIGHWIMDKYKMDNLIGVDFTTPEGERKMLRLLYIDQLYHLAQCMAVWAY